MFKWNGQFEVMRMSQHGVVELWNNDKSFTFHVNETRVKHIFAKDVDCKIDALTLIMYESFYSSCGDIKSGATREANTEPLY